MLEIIFWKNIRDLKQDDKNSKEYFVTIGEIKIFLVSWNAGNTNLTKFTNLNLDSLLYFYQKIKKLSKYLYYRFSRSIWIKCWKYCSKFRR